MDTLYTQSERQIYEFFDGTKDVRRDPMKIQRDFNRALLGEEVEALVKRATDANDEVSSPALDILLPAIRTAFGIEPFSDEGGLTELETVQALFQFYLWAGELGKAIAPSPNGSDCTAGYQEDSGRRILPVVACRTEASMACGSTEVAATT